MNTREHLMSYVDMTNYELEELRNISWPQDRNELNNRMDSLKNFLRSTIQELKQIEKS